MTSVKPAKEHPDANRFPESKTNNAGNTFLLAINNWDDFGVSLGEIKRAYKSAQFDSNLQKASLALHNFIRKQDRRESGDFWKARTLLYELNDIFNLNPEINERALAEGKVHEELGGLSVKWDEHGNVTDAERRLAREKVMFCVCRGNELKRRGKTEKAGSLFEWLLDFTVNKLRTDGFPCFGTQATLSYHLGSIYRILERHDLAERMYTQTLDLLYQRSKRRSETDSEDHVFVMRRQAMAIGIGFGWVNLTRGSLRRAENELATARSLLAGINDPIVPSYIELLYGTIKRCRAGTNKAGLLEAIESLEHARRSFEANDHARYVPRARWELCLAFSVLGDSEEAQKHLDFVAAYAEEVGHPKWQTNVRILQSRLLRNRGDDEGSLIEAESAVTKAKDCKSMLPDAHISRGEARLQIAQKHSDPNITYAIARSDFQKAFDLISGTSIGNRNLNLPSNPKMAAVCQLRIAQCFAREGDETKAKSHFSTWDILRSNVEYEWVRELAVQVESEIDGLLKNFTISAKDPDEWDYARNVTKLRNWLLTQALRSTKRNYSAAAELLGVKRGTLYQWQEDSQKQSKRARTKA